MMEKATGDKMSVLSINENGFKQLDNVLFLDIKEANLEFGSKATVEDHESKDDVMGSAIIRVSAQVRASIGVSLTF